MPNERPDVPDERPEVPDERPDVREQPEQCAKPKPEGAEPRPEACRITVQREGPFLVDGPVEVTLEDGSTVRSDRFRVALCTCRRSRRYPWCDTSHRRRTPE